MAMTAHPRGRTRKAAAATLAISHCQVCNELVCPSCEPLHDEMDEVRCGFWPGTGRHVEFACLRLAQNAFYPDCKGPCSNDLRFQFPEDGTWCTVEEADGLTLCEACCDIWYELEDNDELDDDEYSFYRDHPDLGKFVEEAENQRAEIKAASDFKTQQLLCYGNVAEKTKKLLVPDGSTKRGHTSLPLGEEALASGKEIKKRLADLGTEEAPKLAKLAKR